MMQRIRSEWAEFSRFLVSLSHVELVLLMTLVLLLQHHLKFWYLSGPMTTLVVASLIWPRVRAYPLTWLVALVLLAIVAVRNWFSIDNHQYLIIYWCLALFLMLLVGPEERESCLSRSAALLLGMTMLLATAQKVASSEFMNGGFFEYKLLCDERFESVSTLVGGMTREELHTNRTLHDLLTKGSVDLARLDKAVLERSDGIAWIAIFLTWATVLIEGGLGVLFLLPARNEKFRIFRSGCLVLFIVTTYLVAPVIGFGWTLTAMGLAQLPSNAIRLRTVFVVLFILLPLCKVPVSKIVSVLGRSFGA